MKQKFLSEYKVRQAIVKTARFNEFVKEVHERMRAFKDYIHTVKIDYQMHCKLEIVFHNEDWPDEENKLEFATIISAEDTIVTNYDFNQNPKSVLAQLVTKHFIDKFHSDDLCSYHIVTSIKVEVDHYGCFITDMIAWGTDYIGRYHVEQECGEGWIIVPRNPNQKQSAYCDIRDL